MGYFRTAILLAAHDRALHGHRLSDWRPDRHGHRLSRRRGDEPVRLLELRQEWCSPCMARARSTSARRPSSTGWCGRLAADAGLPMPKVYIMDNPQPNAFATGRNPEHAAVAVTTGLLERLNRDELAGVLAHELGHVKHRDTLTMTITATLAGAISMLANFGFYFGGSRNNDGVRPDRRPAARHSRADRSSASCNSASAAAANTRQTASAPRSANARCRSPQPCARFRARRSRFPIRPPSAIRLRRISSSSTRCRARGWTICSPPTPMLRTASPGWTRSPRAWARPQAWRLSSPRTRVRTLGVAATGRLAEARSLGPDLNRLDHSDELRRRDARLSRRAGGAGRPSGAARGS